MVKGPDTFQTFVMDQLAGLRGATARAMFGGHGLMLGGVLFGMTWRGGMFLRVDESTVAEFVALGSKPFSPSKKMVMKSYYEVPAEVLEDAEKLVAWSRRSAEAARAAKKAKSSSPVAKKKSR
ncbi:MAG: TfoX/Sxy family protein [Planctomycetes bacterium]|nr:TfoX/Sxy family protein [Planctomycetota bacterium]